MNDRCVEQSVVELGPTAERQAVAMLASVRECYQQGADGRTYRRAPPRSPARRSGRFAQTDHHVGHRPGNTRPRRLKSRAIRASTPMPAILKNGRPLRIPASMARCPSSAAAIAVRGSRWQESDAARPLPGRRHEPRAVEVNQRGSASFTVPSPPQTMTRSAWSSAARRASWCAWPALVVDRSGRAGSGD